MESNKYYKPKIEEFHVGFEYEKKTYTGNQKFKKYEFKTYDEPLHIMDNPTVRVKYLDREDIESLGFNDFKHSVADWYKLEKRVPDGYCHYGYWNCFRLVHEYTNHKVKIIAYEYSFEEKDEFILFQGSCKNKSELIKLLKQLGINDTE